MLSTSMPPSAPRSTLEEMLESIKKRDERPKDIPPALPQRPTSKARLPSSVRTRKPISLPSPSLNPSTEAIHLNTSETRVSADSGFCTVESAENKPLHAHEVWVNSESDSVTNVALSNGFPREGQVGSDKTAEEPYKEAAELNVFDQGAVNIAEDTLMEKFEFTKLKDQSTIDSPYKKVNLDSESDDSDYGSSTLSADQEDRKWRGDSISGLNKV
eukprot:Gb_06921 [translate_table: standard]